MTRLRNNISANILSNAWSTALSLLLTPLYVRFLGVEGYGLIGFYLSWVAIIGILDTGLSAAAMRQIAWLSVRSGEEGGIPPLLRSLEVAYWIVLLLAAVAVLLGAWFFGTEWFHARDLSPATVRQALLLMAASLIAQTPSGLYISGLMGLQLQVLSSALLALFGTLRGIGALLLIWLIAPDIRLFFAWQIVVSLLQTGTGRWYLWRRVRPAGSPPPFSFAPLKSVRAFAGGMLVITVLSVLITQADKLILSKLVSLKAFGFYVLAWTVASGLSRVGTPLIQAFSPRFTELVSRGEENALIAQHRLASQLLCALIFPVAALISLLAQQILAVWTGNIEVSRGSAPILTVLVVGVAISVCSFPALSVLYARHRLRPVLLVNATLAGLWLPLLLATVRHYGAIGAAYAWLVYSVTVYIAYQAIEQGSAHYPNILARISRDFLAPAAISVLVALIATQSLEELSGRLRFTFVLAFWLIIDWIAALLTIRECRAVISASFKWQMRPSH